LIGKYIVLTREDTNTNTRTHARTHARSEEAPHRVEMGMRGSCRASDLVVTGVYGGRLDMGVQIGA